MQITVPPEDRVVRPGGEMAVLTSADGEGGGGAVRMNSQARMANHQNNSADDGDDDGNLLSDSRPSAPETPPPAPPQAYNVVIPRGIRPGATFPVSVNGK